MQLSHFSIRLSLPMGSQFYDLREFCNDQVLFISGVKESQLAICNPVLW